MGLHDDKPVLLSPLMSKQEGTKVVLECGWSNYTRIAWFKDEQPIFSNKDMTITDVRTKCLLTIHRASRDHSGEYKCQAYNKQGKIITTCHVDVLPAFEGRPAKTYIANGSVKRVEGEIKQDLRGNAAEQQINRSIPKTSGLDQTQTSIIKTGKPSSDRSKTGQVLSQPGSYQRKGNESETRTSDNQTRKTEEPVSAGLSSGRVPSQSVKRGENSTTRSWSPVNLKDRDRRSESAKGSSILENQVSSKSSRSNVFPPSSSVPLSSTKPVTTQVFYPQSNTPVDSQTSVPSVKKIAGSKSIKDRLAKFSSMDSLSGDESPGFKRTPKDITSKSSPKTPIKGIEKIQSSEKESDQSRDSSSERSQLYRSTPPIGSIDTGISTSQSSSIAEYESCVSSLSGTLSHSSSTDSLHSAQQSQSFSVSPSTSYHSLVSETGSSVTLRSESCTSLLFDQSLHTSISSEIIPCSTETKFEEKSRNSAFHTSDTNSERTQAEIGQQLPICDENLKECRGISSQSINSETSGPEQQHDINHLHCTGVSDLVEGERAEQADTISMSSGSQVDQCTETLSECDINKNEKEEVKSSEIQDGNSDAAPPTVNQEAKEEEAKEEAKLDDDGMPQQARGRIAALSRSFESSDSNSPRSPTTVKVRSGKLAQHSLDAQPTSPETKGRRSVFEKMKMFSSADNTFMEFGVHVTTTKPLEEMTKQAKSIYVSLEEQKRQETVKSTNKSKVKTQLSPSYQSTVKVQSSNAVENAGEMPDCDSKTISYIRVNSELHGFASCEHVHTDALSTSRSTSESVEKPSGLLMPATEHLLVSDLASESNGISSVSNSFQSDSFESFSQCSSYSDRLMSHQSVETDDFTTADEANLSSESEDFLDFSIDVNKYYLEELNEHKRQWPSRDDSTETYLADNFDTELPISQPCMSQAARISNFLEVFARSSSSESMEFSRSTEAIPDQLGETSGSDYTDALTLAVPLQRSKTLSREGSLRSSFEIYKINEESGEEDLLNESTRSRSDSTKDSSDSENAPDLNNKTCITSELPTTYTNVNKRTCVPLSINQHETYPIYSITSKLDPINIKTTTCVNLSCVANEFNQVEVCDKCDIFHFSNVNVEKYDGQESELSVIPGVVHSGTSECYMTSESSLTCADTTVTPCEQPVLSSSVVDDELVVADSAGSEVGLDELIPPSKSIIIPSNKADLPANSPDEGFSSYSEAPIGYQFDHYTTYDNVFEHQKQLTDVGVPQNGSENRLIDLVETCTLESDDDVAKAKTAPGNNSIFIANDYLLVNDGQQLYNVTRNQFPPRDELVYASESICQINESDHDLAEVKRTMHFLRPQNFGMRYERSSVRPSTNVSQPLMYLHKEKCTDVCNSMLVKSYASSYRLEDNLNIHNPIKAINGNSAVGSLGTFKTSSASSHQIQFEKSLPAHSAGTPYVPTIRQLSDVITKAIDIPAARNAAGLANSEMTSLHSTAIADRTEVFSSTSFITHISGLEEAHSCLSGSNPKFKASTDTVSQPRFNLPTTCQQLSTSVVEKSFTPTADTKSKKIPLEADDFLRSTTPYVKTSISEADTSLLTDVQNTLTRADAKETEVPTYSASHLEQTQSFILVHDFCNEKEISSSRPDVMLNYLHVSPTSQFVPTQNCMTQSQQMSTHYSGASASREVSRPTRVQTQVGVGVVGVEYTPVMKTCPTSDDCNTRVVSPTDLDVLLENAKTFCQVTSYANTNLSHDNLLICSRLNREHEPALMNVVGVTLDIDNKHVSGEKLVILNCLEQDEVLKEKEISEQNQHFGSSTLQQTAAFVTDLAMKEAGTKNFGGADWYADEAHQRPQVISDLIHKSDDSDIDSSNSGSILADEPKTSNRETIAVKVPMLVKDLDFQSDDHAGLNIDTEYSDSKEEDRFIKEKTHQQSQLFSNLVLKSDDSDSNSSNSSRILADEPKTSSNEETIAFQAPMFLKDLDFKSDDNNSLIIDAEFCDSKEEDRFSIEDTHQQSQLFSNLVLKSDDSDSNSSNGSRILADEPKTISNEETIAFQAPMFLKDLDFKSDDNNSLIIDAEFCDSKEEDRFSIEDTHQHPQFVSNLIFESDDSDSNSSNSSRILTDEPKTSSNEETIAFQAPMFVKDLDFQSDDDNSLKIDAEFGDSKEEDKFSKEKNYQQPQFVSNLVLKSDDSDINSSNSSILLADEPKTSSNEETIAFQAPMFVKDLDFQSDDDTSFNIDVEFSDSKEKGSFSNRKPAFVIGLTIRSDDHSSDTDVNGSTKDDESLLLGKLVLASEKSLESSSDHCLPDRTSSHACQAEAVSNDRIHVELENVTKDLKELSTSHQISPNDTGSVRRLSSEIACTDGMTPKEFYAYVKSKLIKKQLGVLTYDETHSSQSPRVEPEVDSTNCDNEELAEGFGSSSTRKFHKDLNNRTTSSWKKDLELAGKSTKTLEHSMKLKTSLSSSTKASLLHGSSPSFVSRISNCYGHEGDNLLLKCKVDGQPKPVISWEKEGKPLFESKRVMIYEEDGFSCLEVKTASKKDSGRYTVRANNSKGKAHCSADVEITTKKLKAGSEASSLQKSLLGSRLKDENFDKTRSNGELFRTSGKAEPAVADRSKSEISFISHKLHDKKVSHYAPPSFTHKLQDCEVEEGESLDLECTTLGDDLELDADHSPPQFIKILHDEAVEEGDSLTISCRSSHDDDHGMKTRAPMFTQQLTDQEIEEGDSLTIEVHGSHDYHQTSVPRFVKELSDEEVIEGQDVTIQCKSPQHASCTGAPVFVQKLNDAVAEEGDSLTLKCVNPSSKMTEKSGRRAPSFVTKLEDHEVDEGDSITIECKGPNDHPHSHSYKREYDHVTSISSSASVSNAPPRFVKDLANDEVLEGDSLTISCKNSARQSQSGKPQFVTNLEDQEVDEGGSLTMLCKSSSQRTPGQRPMFVQNLNDHEVTEGDSLVISCKSSGERTQAPKFVKELENEELSEGDSLTFQCSKLPVNGTKSQQNPSSNNNSPPTKNLPPTIVKELTDVTVKVGEKAELVMHTTGTLPMDIVWVHNEDELEPDDPDYIQVSEGHTHRLVISAAFPEDCGTYICEAYNDFGEDDTACELTVLDEADTSNMIDSTNSPPDIVQSLPEMLEFGDDESIELKCEIKNADINSVVWTKNNRATRKGSRFSTKAVGDYYIYRIESSLSIDRGLYTVTATNDWGEVTSTCNLTYNPKKSDTLKRTRLREQVIMDPPRFTTALSDTTVSENERVTMECKLDANPTTTTVLWSVNNKEIKPDKNIEITWKLGVARLTINNASLADQGRYSVIATNESGNDKSSCFLDVHKPIKLSSATPPDAPVGKPAVTEITSQSCLLTWQGPAFDGGAVVEGYRVEMCKASLLRLSQGEYWRTLSEMCRSTSFRVTHHLIADNEYVFRVKAINEMGHGPSGSISDPVLITDRRESVRSISTIGDSESLDYSEYSDYPESEYDPELDEAFLEHDVIVTKESKLEDHYDVQSELGKGKFGSVFLVFDKNTKRQWAAKKIKCRPSQKVDIMNEVDIMKALRHPKLVRLWQVFDHGREMVLIQEYVGGGELFERIVDDDFDLKESDCIRFTKQICDGIGYMHTREIVHLDLKPENVMCVSKHSNQIKLIDFGLARRYKPGDSMKIMFGTPEFVAPEVINYDNVSYHTDVWSIGVITYTLLSGLSPFMGDTDTETLANVTKAAWDFEDEAFDDISELAKDFISQLLVKKPEKRLSASECLKHKWLQDSNRLNGQTLSKSKDKMKKFIARRKWQKTGKAILALTRMRSSFSRMSTSFSYESPTSPDPWNIHSTVLEEEPSTNQRTSLPLPVNNTTSHSYSNQSNENHWQKSSPDDGIVRSTPTKNSSFVYNTEKKDNSKSASITNNQATDSGDSGTYSDRKSTGEVVTDTDDGFDENSHSQPRFATDLPGEIHCIEGDSARFDVAIESDSTLTVRWLKDGEPVSISDRVTTETDEENNKYSLVVRNVRLSDDAEYECRAANDGGEVSSFCEFYVMTNT